MTDTKTCDFCGRRGPVVSLLPLAHSKHGPMNPFALCGECFTAAQEWLRIMAEAKPLEAGQLGMVGGLV